MTNFLHPELAGDDDAPAGFRARSLRLGVRAGCERLGAGLYELGPGEAVCPYHWHAANEELLLVVAGSPSLRTPAGWRELAAGDVVSFRVGEAGAHQIANRGEQPVRVIVFSQMRRPEVCSYPDSGKVMSYGGRPGDAGDPDAFAHMFRVADEVGYWDGEKAP